MALTLPAYSQSNPQQSGTVGTATVTGMVKLGGEPAAGIPMAMVPEQQNRAGGRQPNQPPQEEKTFQSSTDGNGIYRFTGVAAGRYRVMPLTETLVSAGNNPGGGGISISVSEGQAVSQIDFSMARGGIITGRVTDSNNRPIIAERINLTTVAETGQPRQPSGGNRFGLETDDRGVYRAYGLPPGRYLVSAGNDGAGFRPGPAFNRRASYTKTYHPNATEESQAQIVEVTAGSVSENIDIQLGLPVKAYAVSGRAVDSKTSQPVQGVPITVTREVRNGRGGQPAAPGGGNVSSTNAEGEFRIAGLMPGRYSVSVNPINFSGGTAITNEFYSEPTSFEISSDDTTGVELRVNQGASISGLVAIEGVSDPAVLSRLTQLMVFANSRSGQGPQRQAPGQGGGQSGGTTSGSNSLSSVSPTGIFRVGGLAPGTVRLNINAGGLRSGGAFKLIRIERNGALINGDVEVTSGEQVAGIRIVVGYGSAVIQGRVIISGGTLPPGARLTLSARSLSSQTSGAGANTAARVEADGQFRIENLLPGSYELRLTAVTRNVGPGGGRGGQGRGGQGGTPTQPQVKTPEVRQTVTVTNGSPTNVTLNLNLSQ